MEQQEYITIRYINSKFEFDDCVELENKYFVYPKNIQVINDSFIINEHICCTLNSCACKINPFVWVSEKRKAIWFEIPKAASRSIVEFIDAPNPGLTEVVNKLKHYSNFEGVTLYYNTSEKGKVMKDIKDALKSNVIRKFFIKDDFELKFLTPDEAINKYPEYLSFAIFRNPYEKMISNYKMFTQHEMRIHQIKKTFHLNSIENLSFENFINLSIQYPNHHWEKQVKFLPSNINNLNILDTITNLDNILSKLQTSLNISKPLKKLNTTEKSSSNYSKYYDKNTFEIVSSLYEEDIIIYNKITNEDIYNNLGRQFS
ncbi:sulfotransferase family 2 domain-containing protein [Formosa sp. PL04]|uniref:sulfotransferase family 2 domain-containing protein n=1 Tax=Formosa sp. PL04 TaxID=3081755 RepID=UPI0029813A88|nr:sulfotransferase family 2 domain-containing protein [Formosa sp. PL04]MDW5287888.1 sulfotransferase family 2 domain-containing protein [Formosa sp. PL04]